MMRKWIIGVAMVLALFALGGGTALAVLVKVDDSVKTRGVTKITWDSSFHDLNYDLSNPTINMTVNWTVEPADLPPAPAGLAEYDDFDLRRGSTPSDDLHKSFTPRSRNDPARGTAPAVTYPGSNGDNSVDVEFDFTELHLDKKCNVEIGNAHFKLYLEVDTDGVDGVDTVVGYGVNVHVEEPLGQPGPDCED